MQSPPQSPPQDDLQGASRTVGGHLRGKAHGNVFNIADGLEGANDYAKRTGKVHLFTDIASYSRGDQPRQVTIPVSFTMKHILQDLARKWPPIASMSP